MAFHSFPWAWPVCECVCVYVKERVEAEGGVEGHGGEDLTEGGEQLAFHWQVFEG